VPGASPSAGSGRRDGRRFRFVTAASCVLILAGLGWFCIAATHDYLAWNRLRWELGRGLLAEGVDPLALSGGFEFNAWQTTTPFGARQHPQDLSLVVR